jgi:integrase
LTNRKDALKLTETWESVYQRRLTANQARRVIADVVRDLTGENVAGETIADYLRRWATRKVVEVSPSTAHAYKCAANSFIEHLGERSHRMFLDEITTTHVAAWRDAYAKDHAPASVNKTLKCLRVALQDALRESLIVQNVATLVPLLKRQQVSENVRRPFTLKELRRVLDVAGKEWRGLIIAGLYSGQRLGDLAHLTWASVDLTNRQLSLTTGKTGRRVSLPLAEPFEHWLLENVGDQPNAPLFQHAYDCAMQQGRSGQLSREFADLLAAAGLIPKRDHKKHKEGRAARRKASELSFHCLRHTATSLLKNAGVSEAVAMDIIGHESAAMSKVYTHIDDRAKRDAINTLPDVTR